MGRLEPAGDYSNMFVNAITATSTAARPNTVSPT